MPRRKTRRKKPVIEHSYLSVRVEGYEASVDAGINPHVYEPQFAWNLDERDPLYRFTSDLTITGVLMAPKPRAGNAFELHVNSDDQPSSDIYASLKDVHARDSDYRPKYRTYRGREVPVYNAPNGLGLINKVRGQAAWSAWVFVKPGFVSDALAILALDKPLFMAIHERKHDRSRWVQNVSLQTEDPEAEDEEEG